RYRCAIRGAETYLASLIPLTPALLEMTVTSGLTFYLSFVIIYPLLSFDKTKLKLAYCKSSLPVSS
ncbi:MAG: hypothetical protein IKY83_11770, partial [Proteobacteria bacterium]|nr:hypothetical protein [Pseudomonadota bacterium]